MDKKQKAKMKAIRLRHYADAIYEAMEFFNENYDEQGYADAVELCDMALESITKELIRLEG